MMTKDEIKDMRMEATWMENEGRTWDDESLTLLSISFSILALNIFKQNKK